MEPKLGTSSRPWSQIERVCTRVCTASLDWPHPIDGRHLDQSGVMGGGPQIASHKIKSHRILPVLKNSKSCGIPWS